MMGAARKVVSQEPELRSMLESLPGVTRVELDERSSGARVLVAGGAEDLILSAALEALSRSAGHSTSIHVEREVGPAGDTRARFIALDVTTPEPGRIEATVALEWRGGTFRGECSAEVNPAAELRACATATLRAIEAQVGGATRFSLIGVKEIQVFDHNLLVLLIHCPQLPDPRLIGTAIIDRDRRRAAVLAALNATNRVVGRYAGDRD
jgi:hypothetical protein